MTADFPISADDQELLTRAAVFAATGSLSEVTRETVQKLSAQHGVDFATALLYDRVTRSPLHSPFISAINQWPGMHAFSVPERKPIVAVVPAAFYKENPESGADGKLICEEACKLGLRTELIPVSSTGTLAENAVQIRSWLTSHNKEPIILVSVCKGGADAKHALGSHAACFENISTWINVCGTLNGSPVAEWLLASKPRFFVAWLYCKCKRQSIRFLHELAPNGPLSSPLKPPASMQLINVVGFPLRRHLTNRFMRQCHQRVAAAGPTDGGILLADVCRLPGVIYPIWGGDHYLRPAERARRIISAILQYAVTADRQRAPSTLDKTPATDQNARTLLA